MTGQSGGAIYHPSPNHGERRGGLTPTLVVLHYTAMPSAALALERLCDPAWEVSAHYLIGRTGRLWSLVPEQRRAWHAGAGSWGGQGDVNSRSIGIEIDNDGQTPFSAPAMAVLAGLLRQILHRHALPPEAVIAHSDMAPLRKHDPGRRFDWLWLARQGLSVWPGSEPAAASGPGQMEVCEGDAAERFLAAAGRFGYPVTEGLDAVLTAFRLRFRPAAYGPLSQADLEMMQDLASRFPACQPR